MKLQNKIPLYIIAIILVVGAVGSVAIIYVQRQASTHQFEETARAMSATILNGLEQDMLRQDRSHVQQSLDDLNQNEAISEIDIISPSGGIWASTNTSAIDSPTGQAARDLLTGAAGADYVSSYSDDHMTMLSPIPAKTGCVQCHGTIASAPNENGYLGVIRVDISTSFLDESVARSQQILILVSGLTFILVTGTIIYLLRRSVLRPLSRLTGAATKISDGDYTTRVSVDSPKNEIGAVSVAFNEMVDEVESHTRKLERANQDLEEASRLKSEFLANMSHELRTPLNVIIGFSEVLRDTPTDQITESDRREFCDNIVSSGYHLLELINDVLDLAKVEAGQMEMVPEDFYVGTALRDVVATLQPLAAKKGLQIEVSVSDRLTTIFADAAKFKQILYNLMGNAIKFTPEGGTVSITASLMGDLARFAVSDTGIGIAKEDQERIFFEFQQADGSSSRQFDGTGLGLSLTKKFVEMQGGSIWVESEPGAGSTFFFTLPVPAKVTLPAATPADRDLSPAANDSQGVPAAEDLPAPASPAPGILVVEDDKATADLIGVWLANEGYMVDYAADGVEALAKARNSRPFAVCLDIMLPKRDGWQVLHDLKTNPETADVGVIVCSALDNQELGFALGAADYCIKPLSRRHLLDKLRHLQSTTPGGRSQLQVLVADANRDAAQATASALGRQGFGTAAASDGREAIDKALELNPDVIILDLLLPVVSCFDAVSSLRRHPLTADTPIIVTSAEHLSEEEKDFLEQHVQKVLMKRGGREMLLDEIFRLEKLSPERARLIDEETGLFNRRYFRKRLVEEVRRAERYSLVITAVLVALRQQDGTPVTEPGTITKAAGVLRANIRAADPLARYDENSFAVLLPETRHEAGMVVAEKIVRYLRQADLYTSKNGNQLVVNAAVADSANGKISSEQIITSLERAILDMKGEGGSHAVQSVR